METIQVLPIRVRVTAVLRKALLSGEYQPGEELSLTEMAAKLGVSIDGATLYCTHQPCGVCAKMIVNSGIVRVVYREGYPDDFAREILKEGGVLLERYDK